MQRIAIQTLLLGLFAAVPLAASSAPITLTLSDSAVQVTYGGVAQTVDLTVVAVADTANFTSTLASGAGSGYGNVFLTYTSAALGLAGVTGSELWDFTWKFGGSQDSVILDDAGIFAGQGAFGFGGAISAWNGISSLGPVGPSTGSVSNAGIDPTDTIGGTSFVINGFGNGSTFSAVVGTVPEPGTFALLGLGLAGLAATGRRKQ